jgi:type IV pilus assembly protein PilW
MTPQKIYPKFSLCQGGLSLVELMIAITLSFIVVIAVGYAYLGSRQSFRVTDNMSRIQENARAALQIIAHDVRMAGYIGCGNLQSATVNTIANSPVPALSTSNAITGLDTGAGATTFGGITRPAGDVVSVIGAFGGGVNLTGNVTPANANIQVQGNPDGFQQNDVLVVTNCTNADVFRVTNNPGSSGMVTLSHSSSSNTGNRVGTYDTDAFVIKLEQYTYFIGTNPSGGSSLYRDSLTSGTVEIADNVQDMQIDYGIDPSNSGAATSYVTASAVTDWAQVVSARISLLLVSQENVLAQAQTYNFNASAVTSTSSDRRMYRVFTTTVGVRNRLS